jgi:phage terminase small subunit
MGKAKHPHDATRPETASVRKALEKQDIEALKLALTPRQRAFAHEYVVDFNATAAAIRAGYATKHADKQAHLLLQHKGIAFLIDHLTKSKAAKILSVDPDYVIQRLTAIIDRQGARDGDVIRALELIARHLGMLTDKQEIKMDATIDTKIEEDARDFTTLLRGLQKRAEKREVELLDGET